MKHTATPVGRPTARCIWNSFRASGKRHLILTGTRGSGKSTLLAGLLPYLRETGPVSGITTRAQPWEAVFLTDAGSGRCAQIGAFDPRLPGPHYTPAEACSWHEGLLEALERADVDLYRSRMRGHFDGVRIRLSKAEPEDQGASDDG